MLDSREGAFDMLLELLTPGPKDFTDMADLEPM